jgi:transcription antitermination factor NusB
MFRIKYSREAVLKLLYVADVLNLKDIHALQLLHDNSCFFKGLNDKEKDFITQIINKVLKEKNSIDRSIAENLIGWKLERLMPVDRSLLRMGVAEAFFNDQKAIIIDDIIRIAKKYGSEESYKIINAILDKVIQ